MREQSLRPSKRVPGVGQLMIKEKVAAQRPRILRAARVTPVFASDAIDLADFLRCPVSSGAARRQRFLGVWTRPDPHALQFQQPGFCLATYRQPITTRFGQV
jgi:hypothetical protein